MPAVSLPFFLEGKEFDPKVFLEDLEKYEDEEAVAIKKGRLSALVRLRQDFVAKVLGREDGCPKELRLTAAQVSDAFWAVWRGCQGRAPDPLE